MRGFIYLCNPPVRGPSDGKNQNSEYGVDKDLLAATSRHGVANNDGMPLS